jgi:hypothetical protein
MVNPRKVFVSIAREDVGVREVTRNQAPEIRKYWDDTDYKGGFKNREPYCAAFVCYVVAEAIRRGHGVGPTPTSAAVRNIVTWAGKLGNGAVRWTPSNTAYTPQAGDLVWWAFGGKSPNHIGIVAGKQGVNRITTIEANTNPAGSREGDGVYERQRSISACGGFIRLAWKAGKA